MWFYESELHFILIFMASSFMLLRYQLRQQKPFSILTNHYFWIPRHLLAHFFLSIKSRSNYPSTYIFFFTIITSIITYSSVMGYLSTYNDSTISNIHILTFLQACKKKKKEQYFRAISAKQHCLPVGVPGAKPRTSWYGLES